MRTSRNGQLMGKQFLMAIAKNNLGELEQSLCTLRDWYWDMREFRDPAADRIPIIAPCALYSESDAKEMEHLDSESANTIEKGDRVAAREAFHKSTSVGQPMPIFIPESTAQHFYDLAARINQDHLNWHSVVEATLREGFK